MTRKNPIGDHNIINTATPEKMMIIKNKYYYPNNSILVVCGDVQHEETFDMAEKIFGDWPNSGFNPHEKYPIPPFAPLKSTDYFIKETSIAKTPYINYWWQGPDYPHDSAATIAADVFSTILSMNSSKWQQALIDKGLATYANVSYQLLSHVGPINIDVAPNPNKIQECHLEILKQVGMWADDNYFSDEQLADAKQIIRRNQVRTEEKPSTFSSRLTYFWCTASLDYYNDYLQNRMKVTRTDIQDYIRKYVTIKPYVAGMVINAEMNKSAHTASFFKP
jgi:zinc protease